MEPPIQNLFKRIFTGTLFFSITIIVAVVITVFGMGYGEIEPLDSTDLRVFTILMIIAGTLSVTYTVMGFVQMVTAGEIRRALCVGQMTQENQSLTNHAVVRSYGRMDSKQVWM